MQKPDSNPWRTLLRLSIVVLISAVVIVSVIPAAAVAQNDWADDCDSAEVLDSGAYSGTLSPGDADHFRVNLSEGDYMAANLSFSTAATDGKLRYEVDDRVAGEGSPKGSLTAVNGSDLVAPESQDTAGMEVDTPLTGTWDDGMRMTEGQIAFRTYSESDKPICIRVETAGDYAGEWAIAFTTVEATPPPVTVSQPAGDESVAALQEQVEAQNESIAELESTIEQLEARIQALEDQLNVTATEG